MGGAAFVCHKSPLPRLIAAAGGILSDIDFKISDSVQLSPQNKKRRFRGAFGWWN